MPARRRFMAEGADAAVISPPAIQIALPDALVSSDPSPSSMSMGGGSDNASFPSLAPTGSAPNSPAIVAASPSQSAQASALSPLGSNDSFGSGGLPPPRMPMNVSRSSSNSLHHQNLHQSQQQQQQHRHSPPHHHRRQDSGGDSSSPNASSPNITPPVTTHFSRHDVRLEDDHHATHHQITSSSGGGGDDSSAAVLVPRGQHRLQQQQQQQQHQFSHNRSSTGKKKKKRHRRVSLVDSGEEDGADSQTGSGLGSPHGKDLLSSPAAPLTETDKKDNRYVRQETSSIAARLGGGICCMFVLWLITFIAVGIVLLVSFTLTERGAVAAKCLQDMNCNDLPTAAEKGSAAVINRGLFIPTHIVNSFPRWCWKQCQGLVAAGREVPSSAAAAGGGSVVEAVINTTASTAWYELDSIAVTVSRPSISSRAYTLTANSTNNSPPRAPSAQQVVIELPTGSATGIDSNTYSAEMFAQNSKATAGQVIMKDAASTKLASELTLHCELRFASSELLTVLLAESSRAPLNRQRRTRLAASSSSPALSVADTLSNPEQASCAPFAGLVFNVSDPAWCDPSATRSLWLAAVVILMVSGGLALVALLMLRPQLCEYDRIYHSACAVVEEMTVCATIMNTNWGTYKYDSKDIDLSEVEIASTLVKSDEGRLLLARKVRAKKNLENLLSFVPLAARNPAMRDLQERDLDDGSASGSGLLPMLNAGGAVSSGDSDENNDDPILVPLRQQGDTSSPQQQQQQPLPFLAITTDDNTAASGGAGAADFRNFHLSAWDPRVPTPNHPLSKVPSYRSDISGGGGGGGANSAAVSGMWSKEQVAAYREAIPNIGVTPDPSFGSGAGAAEREASGGSAGGLGGVTTSGGLLSIPDASSRRVSSSTQSSEYSGGGPMRRASSVMDRRAASRLRRSATPFMGPSLDSASVAATINSSAPSSLESSSLVRSPSFLARDKQQEEQLQSAAGTEPLLPDFTHVRLAPGSVMRRRRCSALFCKLHFNAATQLTPSRLLAASELLDQFVFDVSHTANSYGGVVVEYGFGTALIQWNGFTPYGLHETQSCLCALALAGHFQSYEDSMRFYTEAAGGEQSPDSRCDFGMCVNTGIMTVGFCGTVGNLSMFCLGDAVAHLRHGVELGRLIGCRVVALHETMKAANARILTVPVDVCSFDNGATKTLVHEVRGDGHMESGPGGAAAAGSLTSFSMNKSTTQEEQNARPHFMKGFMMLHQGRYDDAHIHFQAAKDENGNDPQIDRLLQLTFTLAEHTTMLNMNRRNPGGGEDADGNNNNEDDRVKVEYVRLAPAWLFPEADLETMAALDEQVAASLMQLAGGSDNSAALQAAIGPESAAAAAMLGSLAMNNSSGGKRESQTPPNAAATDFMTSSSANNFNFESNRAFENSGGQSSSEEASAGGGEQFNIREQPRSSAAAPMIQLFSDSNPSSVGSSPSATVNVNNEDVQKEAQYLQQQQHQQYNARAVRADSHDGNYQYQHGDGETVLMVVDSPSPGVSPHSSPHSSYTDYSRMLSNASDHFRAAVDNNKVNKTSPPDDGLVTLLGGNTTPICNSQQQQQQPPEILSPVGASASCVTAPFGRASTTTPGIVTPTDASMMRRDGSSSSGRNTTCSVHTDQQLLPQQHPPSMVAAVAAGGVGALTNSSLSAIPVLLNSTPMLSGHHPPSQETTQPHFPSRRGSNITANNSVNMPALPEPQLGRVPSGALLGATTPHGSMATMAGRSSTGGGADSGDDDDDGQSPTNVPPSHSSVTRPTTRGGGGGDGRGTGRNSASSGPPSPRAAVQQYGASTTSSSDDVMAPASRSASALPALPEVTKCECEIPKFTDRDGNVWTCGSAFTTRNKSNDDCGCCFGTFTGVAAGDGSLAELDIFHLPPVLTRRGSFNNNSSSQNLDEHSHASTDEDGSGNNGKRTPLGRGNNNNTTTTSLAEEALVEIRAANAVRHVCIQSLHSVALTPCNHLILVKEICGGGTLAELVEKFGGLGMTALRRYAQDIARGIAAYHAQRGAAHGAVDVKNVLLSTDGNCKLVTTTAMAVPPPAAVAVAAAVPAGQHQQQQQQQIAAANSANSSSNSSTMFSLLQRLLSSSFRTAHRSDEFCAPELVETDGASVAGDIWSYGILLCYLYNGESPYKTAFTAMQQGVLDPNTPLRVHIGNGLAAPVNPIKGEGVGSLGNSSLSAINFSSGDETDEMLRGLIDQCLKKNPGKRCSFQQVLGHPFFLF